jgi:PTH1 family peptidyl-tRNA hydrolase
MAVDALAAAEGIQLATTQLRALVGKGVVAGKQVLLVKPQTFMNSSGESVVPLLKFYKVPPSRLLVVYDDLDIDVRSFASPACMAFFATLTLLPRRFFLSVAQVAALRLRKKGGHGGHNGMRSIVTCLSGSQDFARLRIGIGRPQGQRAVSDHVLTTFDKREAQDVEVAVVEACDVVRSVLDAGVDRAMSKHNVSGAGGGGGGGGAAAAAQPAKRPRTQNPPPA